MHQHPALQVLHSEIDTRIAATTAAQPDFPCRRGCDHCCRHLAALPYLTEPEWDLLRSGIEQLPEAIRAEVSARLAGLGHAPPRPVVCPLLDSNTGACLVYAYRPTACRTYGFYVERDKGLYCGIIQSAVERDELAHIVWGNHASVEQRLAALGPSRSLSEWAEQAL